MGNSGLVEYMMCFRTLATCLCTLGILAVSCSDQGNFEDIEVLSTFIHLVEDRSITTEDQSIQARYYQFWGITVLSFGAVRQIGDTDSNAYEISFTDPSDGKKESWTINVDTKEVRPINLGALFTAILLFCKDRSDPNPDCVNYFKITDGLRNP